MGHEFGAAGMVFVLVHHLAQFCFHFGKGLPPVLRPFPEALRELRQRNALFARVDQFLNILFGVKFRIITGMQFQSFFKIPQSAAFLVQIVIGIAHTEVPGISVSQFLLVGLHQFQCPVKQFSSLRLAGVRQIVAGPRQLHIGFRGALLGGDGLQRVDDLLVFAVLMPLPALLQNIHIQFLLILYSDNRSIEVIVAVYLAVLLCLRLIVGEQGRYPKNGPRPPQILHPPSPPQVVN